MKTTTYSLIFRLLEKGYASLSVYFKSNAGQNKAVIQDIAEFMDCLPIGSGVD